MIAVGPPDDGTGEIVSILLAFSRRLGNRGWHGNKFVGMAAIGTKRTIAALQKFVRYWTRVDKRRRVLWVRSYLDVVTVLV